MEVDQDDLRHTIETLAALDRPPCSEGERQAALWLADRLRQEGCTVALESDEAFTGFARTHAGLSAIAATAGLLGARRDRRARLAGAALGLAAAAAVADDCANGPRLMRPVWQRRGTTTHVIATAGDPGTDRTLVILAHHDAAPSGRVFDPAPGRWLARTFPGVVERLDTALPIWWPVLAGPLLAAAGATTGRRGVAVAGGLLAAPLGALAAAWWSAGVVMVLAGVVYSICGFVTLRLPHPRVKTEPKPIGRRGRVEALTGPAIGAAGMRAATGFLLFLSAFAIRREGFPTSWFGAMAIAAAAGGFLADLLAPRLPETIREEFIVVGCTLAAGVGAFLAFSAFSLPVLAFFGLLAGAATELGRLAFQSLMQHHAPEGALGRVFVRYEVV
ncbi:MAG TPA: MFS transporter, partial [Baekduia sp.]|nr:MFS transporter [Baekduia sp.]